MRAEAEGHAQSVEKTNMLHKDLEEAKAKHEDPNKNIKEGTAASLKNRKMRERMCASLTGTHFHILHTPSS